MGNTIQKTASRQTEIDIMRCICILWVVAFSHLTDYTPYPVSNPPVFFATRIMLASMFFVSGFLNSKKQFLNYKDCFRYYLTRFSHSYIPLFFACMAAYAEKILIHDWLFQNMKVFIRTLFGVSCIVTPAPATLWFICTILIFYALTPFLIWKYDLKQMLFKSLGAYALMLLLHFVFHLFDDRVLLYFPIYVSGLFFNMLLPVLQNKKIKTAGFILCACCVVVLTLTGWNHTKNYFFQFATAAFGIPLVYLIAKGFGKIRGVSRFLAFLGKAGMSFYLFHRQIYSLLQYFFGKTFSPWFAYLVALPVCILLGILIDFLLHRLMKAVDTLFGKLRIPSGKVS
ncbi:MAG: acyltransferase [Lachnospiraceae bacterium]|nr:acyltransferase [Lachnospiraceae bacterium]